METLATPGKRQDIFCRLKRLLRQSRLADIMRFLYVQRIKGFTVPSSPHFDSAASTTWFMSQLQICRHYLEYGTGGSTYLAAQLGKSFIAVDSDRFFLDAVRSKIIKARLYDEPSQRYIHADIGLTLAWGTPFVWGALSQRRMEKFARYSDMRVNGLLPDLILVDGRFRVACALKAFKVLLHQPQWTLVIDDYVGRPHYEIIEQFAKPTRLVGRMAVFTELLPLDESALAEAIAHYEMDPR